MSEIRPVDRRISHLSRLHLTPFKVKPFKVSQTLKNTFCLLIELTIIGRVKYVLLQCSSTLDNSTLYHENMTSNPVNVKEVLHIFVNDCKTKCLYLPMSVHPC